MLLNSKDALLSVGFKSVWADFFAVDLSGIGDKTAFDFTEENTI